MKTLNKLKYGITLLAVAGLSLTACAGGAGSASNDSETDSSGIESGASKEEFIEAFQDIEPIELDFQISVDSPDSYLAQREIEYAESLNEWSGGTITVNVHYAGSIVAPQDVDDAVVDGRLDLGFYYATYEPDQMPAYADLARSMVQGPNSPLAGEIVTHAVLLETAFNTEEIMNEFTERGMYPLFPTISNGNTVAACVEPRESLTAWQGSQVRGIAGAHETQISGLGGTVSSVDVGETFDALQRGVLDCSLQAPNTGLAAGWAEVAPYILSPRERSFAPGPSALVAGSSWDELPLLAQQLMIERLDVYLGAELSLVMQSMMELSDESTSHGGDAEYLDETSEAALAEANDELVRQIEESTNLDGSQLNEDVLTGIEKWTDVAHELGYVDEGGLDDFPDWYQGSDDFEDREYLVPIVERIFEDTILPQRPE